MRNMPRIAAEPFMRIVGQMLDLELAEEMAEAGNKLVDAEAVLSAVDDDPA